MLKNLTISKKTVTLLLLQKIITQLPHTAPGKHPFQLLHTEELSNESLWRGNSIPQRHSQLFFQHTAQSFPASLRPNIHLKRFAWYFNLQMPCYLPKLDNNTHEMTRVNFSLNTYWVSSSEHHLSLLQSFGLSALSYLWHPGIQMVSQHSNFGEQSVNKIQFQQPNCY